MSLPQVTVIALSAISLFQLIVADVMVQLSVNRPYNDVSDKFVSFIIAPEDLYKALDGPNRKSLTRMATLLGDSYVKFVGEYNFVENAEMRLRNPTKIIWKGFNRWTRAVNWTMVIPVPYSPDSFDPMASLKILNSSHMVGITDCIWQLGTDFGSSHAEDYVADLNTLKLMVDSYKPFVDEWKILGADVSPGSSPEETKRYVEMSKDLNAAFGWLQPTELIPGNSIGSFIYENDPALKVLLNKKVPVWLTLPQRTTNLKQRSSSSTRSNLEEIKDAMRWAQTLGDAASEGFDAVFQKINLSDLERPSFTFYVTAMFKKVMGSRVFPARPLAMFAHHNNKLYTHCANSVSGGLAFMVVNTEEDTMQIAIRSLTALAGKEVWQYTLTAKKRNIYLNNEKLSLNSTMRPHIKIKNPSKPVQLSAPGLSVSFWVLPTVDLEHCQYTEVEVIDMEEEIGSVQKKNETKYSSSDRLLKQLITEAASASTFFTRPLNRNRRYITKSRQRRFVLEDKSPSPTNRFGKLFEPIATTLSDKTLRKRDNERRSAFDWFKDLMENGIHGDTKSLRRETRSAENYFGPFFATKDGKKTGITTKKITEIKKPEKKVKPLFDLEEFDEEEFFKKIDEQQEPEYKPLPNGDVHLRHIMNPEGEELDDYREEKKRIVRRKQKVVDTSKEIVSEMKPLRLLPTEFYEALPMKTFKPATQKLSIGNALNSFLFPEPFSKKTKDNAKKTKGTNKLSSEITDKIESIEDEIDTLKLEKSTKLAQDFLRAQKELRKVFLAMSKVEEKRAQQEAEEQDQREAGDDEEKKNGDENVDEAMKYIDYLAESLGGFFGEKEDDVVSDKSKSKENDAPKKELDEIPWWDLSEGRKKRTTRALKVQVPDEVWNNNMIDKDDDLTPLGAMTHELVVAPNAQEVRNTENRVDDQVIPHILVKSVKKNVETLVDVVARHVSEWYNTLTKHIDVENSTATNNVQNDAN